MSSEPNISGTTPAFVLGEDLDIEYRISFDPDRSKYASPSMKLSPISPVKPLKLELGPFPEPVKTRCHNRHGLHWDSERVPVDEYDKFVKKGRIRKLWDGQTKPLEPGFIVCIKSGNAIFWYCNTSWRWDKRPTGDEYLKADGAIEGVCGSRIVGSISVPRYEWIYGRAQHWGEDYWCDWDLRCERNL
ncbi:hypothetical protein BJ508DRAFT_363184 [Ascobolus immersus RN42]|uniref:Uncharacterized protein n=1 Tax=Ascobolus immersus RN42 TaxID=1160509 RepID=A0A3N4I1Y9_ASCIM|nr:hypothetical protein BJ508DRAFT_363184 [Ascobolus immersus RN42]